VIDNSILKEAISEEFVSALIQFIKDYLSQVLFLRKIYLRLKWIRRHLTHIYLDYTFDRINRFSLDQIRKTDGPVVFVSRPIAFTFPLSYGYLAGYLLSRGIEVKIVFKTGSARSIAKEILKHNPILVGFGSLYPEIEEIRSIVYELNVLGRDFPIAVGGQMVSPIPEFSVKITGADFGVVGEGEIIIFQIVEAIKGSRSFSEIGGLAVRNGRRVTVNPGGEYIADLSQLPEIPYELFPTHEWLRIGRWYTKNIPTQPHWRFNDRVINVHGGRGCPFKCNFCYHHNKPRYRDIQVMMDEAEKNLLRFDANMLYFSDDLVIANPKRVRDLISRIRTLPRPIAFSISTRFDILEKIDDELLSELKSVGCRIMGLGIESGSDRILKIIGKNTTAEKILIGLKRLKHVGILPTVSIMVGQDSETVEDAEQSLQLMVQSVRENPNIQYAFTIATPFPGSPLYQKIFKLGLLKDDQDFYNRYFNSDSVGDWNHVVNMSAMSVKTVINFRENLEKIYFLEKEKAYGKKVWENILGLGRQQKSIAEVYEKLSPSEQNHQLQDYELRQLELESRKLAAMGLQ
jgi:radical SAM superfamily enzyme YgiQ (UPF0313 family)